MRIDSWELKIETMGKVGKRSFDFAQNDSLPSPILLPSTFLIPSFPDVKGISSFRKKSESDVHTNTGELIKC